MSATNTWLPGADWTTLKRRACLLRDIRAFFTDRDVWEVDTQLLSLASISDPHIEVLSTQTQMHGKPCTLYLQTSPEFAMKRLLCAGADHIYQLGKVFRAEECGRRHAIEFTMLEWYRTGLDHWQLMKEIEDLLVAVSQDGRLRCDAISYGHAFRLHTGLDPFTAELSELQNLAHQETEYGLEEKDRDTLLELLFCHLVEPRLGKEQPCFVHSYPASQAALAKVEKDAEGNSVAARFELYWRGMELANGYHELTDAGEQQCRFDQDMQQRRQDGKTDRAVDTRLIQALEQGMSDCAGVALGVDRLLMLLVGATHIDQVIPFTGERA